MQYLTVKQVAERLQVCEETVRRWCRDNLLPCKKIGKDWRIPETAVSTPPPPTMTSANGTIVEV